MKLDYNILWLDNDLKDYIDTGDVNSIKDYLLDLGFEPKIITVFDESDIDQYLDIKYDLIISDFNLNKENGDVIIYRLREEKGLDTEILFYSAKTNFYEDEKVKNRLAFMERINIQFGRDTLLEKIEKVISLTIGKLLELNATRGLITAATSDLDVEIEEVYNLLIELPIENELKHKIETIFAKDYKEVRKNYFKQCIAKRKCHTSNYKQYFELSDSFRKFDILKEFLKLQNFPEFDLKLFKLYSSQVIDIRNKFAHAKAVKINGNLVLKGRMKGLDFSFNDQKCILIRKDLIKHKRNIEILKESILKMTNS